LPAADTALAQVARERDAPVLDVDAALAYALAAAARAGRFDVVSQLARELEARRLANSNVVAIASKRGARS